MKEANDQLHEIRIINKPINDPRITSFALNDPKEYVHDGRRVEVRDKFGDQAGIRFEEGDHFAGFGVDEHDVGACPMANLDRLVGRHTRWLVQDGVPEPGEDLVSGCVAEDLGGDIPEIRGHNLRAQVREPDLAFLGLGAVFGSAAFGIEGVHQERTDLVADAMVPDRVEDRAAHAAVGGEVWVCGRGGGLWVGERAVFLVDAIGLLVVEDQPGDVAEDAEDDLLRGEELDEFGVLGFDLLEEVIFVEQLVEQDGGGGGRETAGGGVAGAVGGRGGEDRVDGRLRMEPKPGPGEAALDSSMMDR